VWSDDRGEGGEWEMLCVLFVWKNTMSYNGSQVMNEQIHPVADKIESILREGGFWYEKFLHEPVRTSEEAAKVRPEYVQHQGTKALIVSAKQISADPVCNKRFIMLVVPGDKQFDKKKVKSELGFTDVRFALEDEVAKITEGVLPGGVPPFGNLFGLPVFVDIAVFDNEKIIFNAGDRRVSIGMKSADYRTLVTPTIADFAESKS
jgi:Ala-tRNA(Pro) deacylase